MSGKSDDILKNIERLKNDYYTILIKDHIQELMSVFMIMIFKWKNMMN